MYKVKNMKTIRKDEHVLVAGATGTGKTYLAAKYLEGYNNVVVLDTKAMFYNWEKMEATGEVVVIDRLANIGKVKNKKIIYRPVFQELNEEMYNHFFSWIYRRENTIVLIDETMQISPTPFKLPEFAKGILQRGRQKNVSIWALTQRPQNISPLFISEAKHLFVFRLNLEQDRKKLVHVAGFDEFMHKPEKYVFWYADVTKDEKPIKGKI